MARAKAKATSRSGSRKSVSKRPAGRNPDAAVDRKPEPPFPKQDQERPGIEAKMKPRPRYSAPDYRGSGKLQDKVALITGGDSGIGGAVAVQYAREGQPEEVAPAFVLFASAMDSSYITGEVLTRLGGETTAG